MHSAVIVLQSDSASADRLVTKLNICGRPAVVVHSLDELKACAFRSSARAGVIDLAVVSPREIDRLHRDFAVDIVCTHRFADDHMWTEALAAGALDCCFDDDYASIIAALRGKAAVAAAV
jgi:hypothetical protein